MNRKTLKAVSLVLSIAVFLSTVFISGIITLNAVNTTAQEPFFENFEGETVGDPIDQINTWQSSPAVIVQENENKFMSLKRSISDNSATALLMSDVLNLSDNGSAIKTFSVKFKIPKESISDADSKGVRFRIYYWKQTEKVENVSMGDYYFDIYYMPATDGGKWYLYASGANSTTGYEIDADLTEWTQFSMRYYLSKNDPISVISNKASPITTGSFYYTEWNLSQGNEILLANGSYDGQNALQWYNFGRYGTVPTKLKESYPDGVLPVSGYGTTVGFSIESGTTYKDKSNADVSFTDEPTVLFDDIKLTYYSEAEVNKKIDLYSSTTQSDDLGLGGYSRVNGLNNDAYYSEYVANSQYVREENDQSEVSFDFEDAIVPFYPTVLPEQKYEESQKVVSINSASIVSDPIGADNKVLKLRNNINQCATYAAGYKFELFDSVCSDDNLIDNVSFDIYNPNGAPWSFIYEDNDFTSDSYDGTDANNLCRYITFGSGTNSAVQMNYTYVTGYNADTCVETRADALFAGASNTKVTWKDWVHINLKYDYDENYIIYTFTGKDTNGVEQTATHINRGTVYTNVYAAKKIAFGLLHTSTLEDLYIDNFSMSYVNNGVSVDKNQLQSLYNANLDKIEADYTPGSWSNFATALADAKEVLDSIYATQLRVDEAQVTLSSAINGLILLSSIDRAPLQSLYDANKDRVQSDYTSVSWDPFVTALINSKTALDNKDSTQEQIDSAKAQLSTAISNLVSVSKVDKSELQNLYNANKNKEEGKYTPKSWSVFSQALQAAFGVLESNGVIQTEINTAKANLESAVAQLVIKANKTELQSIYNQNVDKQKQDYTSESWAVFKEALTTAKTVIDDANATQSDVDAAKDRLSVAVDGLSARLPSEKPLQIPQPQQGDTVEMEFTKDNFIEGDTIKFVTAPKENCILPVGSVYCKVDNGDIIYVGKTDNSFEWTVPDYSTTIKITAKYFSAPVNEVTTFGVSKKQPQGETTTESDTEKQSGLQFGSVAYDTVMIDNTQYERVNCGTIIIEGDSLGGATPKEWYEAFDGRTGAQRINNYSGVKIARTTYLDDENGYVQYSARLYGLIESNKETQKYTAFAYAVYSNGDKYITLFSAAKTASFNS